MAARTRSRLSWTATSGRPTMEKAGAAATTSASTWTGLPCRPLRASLAMLASNGPPFAAMSCVRTGLPYRSSVNAAGR